jgi:hypothetical protein
MASSSNDSLSAAASGAGSLASILVLSISRNRAEVSSQNLIYGKFPQMQEDFCEFLSQESGGSALRSAILSLPRFDLVNFVP